ncbi:hypothetical protein L1987_36338 [Smallanthus sonchifolius]|uniref:Uncharacterized protein n=1 Tax=Smallanthus sonchifolius TaxID=185202 RepID=A0ACB9HDB4_9ASTR|nr:hypothetical protein L1987_36338 [Smallanthus sonchifolius]
MMASFLNLQLLGFLSQLTSTIFTPNDEVMINFSVRFLDYQSLFYENMLPCKISWRDLINVDDIISFDTYLEGYKFKINRSGGTFKVYKLSIGSRISVWKKYHVVMEEVELDVCLPQGTTSTLVLETSQLSALSRSSVEEVSEPSISNGLRSSELNDKNSNNMSGFTDPLGKCLWKDGDALKACANPLEYISWDGIHHTEAANKWVADHIQDGFIIMVRYEPNMLEYRHGLTPSMRDARRHLI